MPTGALAGKTAFITGANGAIATASAKLLLQDGAAVLLMGRREDAVAATRDRLAKDVPGAEIEIHAGAADSVDDVRSGLEKAHAIHGRLDILVPTVGGGGFKPLLLQDAQSFRADLELNIVTVFLVVRYGAPLMKPGGSIVCISSTAAIMPFAFLASYCTAKGGLEQFIRSAADELGSAGIRVNAVRPGMTRSNATGGMFDTPAVIDRFVEQMPLGRGGEPEDIAPAVRFLAGPESAYMTGQSFAVDGGHELRRNPDLSFMMSQMIGQETLDRVRRGESPS